MFGTVFSAPLNRNFDAEVLGFFYELRSSCLLPVFCLVKTDGNVFSAPLIQNFWEPRGSHVLFLLLFPALGAELFGDLLQGANLGLNVNVVAAASFHLLHQVIVQLLILNRWTVEVLRRTLVLNLGLIPFSFLRDLWRRTRKVRVSWHTGLHLWSSLAVTDAC